MTDPEELKNTRGENLECHVAAVQANCWGGYPNGNCIYISSFLFTRSAD
jgi:hypothetical protein